MKKSLLATALVAFAPALLLADEPTAPAPPHAQAWFKRLDTNGDGVITRDEAQAAATEHVNKMFDKLDTNKDGKITPEELAQAHAKRMAAMKARFEERFKAADKNGDGLISKEEAAQSMPMIARHFDEIDTNKDGQVSLDELKAFHAKMRHWGPAHRSSSPPSQS